MLCIDTKASICSWQNCTNFSKPYDMSCRTNQLISHNVLHLQSRMSSLQVSKSSHQTRSGKLDNLSRSIYSNEESKCQIVFSSVRISHQGMQSFVGQIG